MLLQELLAERPQADWIQYQLGKVCFAMNEIESAIRHFEQAIALNPNDTDSRYWIGGIKHAIGDFDAAEAAYAAAMQIRPLVRRKAIKSPPDFRLLALYAPFNGNTPIIAVGLKITEVAWVGILTVFAVTFLTQQLGMSRSIILAAITLGGLIEVLVMPLAGWLSDVIGRRVIYLAGTMFGILLAFPILWLFETRDPTIVTWAIVVGICLCQGVIFALHASVMPELFGTDARYSGVSLGFQFGAAIGGGLTPMIAAAIVARTGATWAVSLILVALGIVKVIAVLSTRETAARPMRS
jgi:hypothetical protein